MPPPIPHRLRPSLPLLPCWRLTHLTSPPYPSHPAVHDEGGRQVFRWNPGEIVTAMAYDNPIPGFDTNNTNNLRLWAAKPDREFDLQAFNTGDYVQVCLCIGWVALGGEGQSLGAGCRRRAAVSWSPR